MTRLSQTNWFYRVRYRVGFTAVKARDELGLAYRPLLLRPGSVHWQAGDYIYLSYRHFIYHKSKCGTCNLVDVLYISIKLYLI